MTLVTAPANGAARRSRHPAPAPRPADRDPGCRAFGIYDLLRIATLGSRGPNRRAFVTAVLDAALRGLHAEAAILVAPAADAGHESRHAGPPAVVRRLLAHVRARVQARAERALTWSGEQRGLGVLGALIPQNGQTPTVLCVGRDPQGARFLPRERDLLLGYAQTAALVLERTRAQECVDRQRADVTAAFVSALASRDGYLQGHSTRVAIYAHELARVLGLPGEEVRVARRTGILHDLGKLSTPDCILLKPAALTDDEYGHIKQHPVVSAALLEPYAFLAAEAAAVKRHHERYDGAGYPDGLRGAEIPLAARLVSVADAFDAMTSDRPYRQALPLAVAREEIRRGAGCQFDPAVTDAWLTIPDARLAEIRRHPSGGRDTIDSRLPCDGRAATPARWA